MVMTTLRAKRTLAGNIALVIFLAFLTTLTIGICPGSALADNNIDVQGDSEKTVSTNSRDSLELTVKLCPLTQTQFSSVLLNIYKAGVYDNSISVYDIYNADPSSVSSAYDSVYGAGYNIVYAWTGLNLDYGTNTGYQFLVSIPGTLYKSIDLTIEGPPRPSSGGGSTTTPAVETEVETTTDSSTGTVQAGGTLSSTTTDSGEASVAFTVDSTGVENQVTNEQVTRVEFVVPEQVNGVDVAEAAVEVPADTLAAVFEAEKPAVVKVADVVLELPVDSLDLSAFADQDVDLKFNISKAEEGSTPAADTAVYKIAGQVYHINIRAEQDGVDKGSVSLSKPVTLTLPYDKSSDVNTDQLMIYRLNETTNTWEAVGGTVDPVTGTVSVTRSSLSIYTVMAYTKVFADMTGHWAAGDVQLMAAREIVKGMSETTFAPDSNVTRAQFAALMLRTMDIDETGATGTIFSDVAAGAWYAGAVEAAASNALINGYPDGSFKPDASITREEMAAVISRALGQSGITSVLSGAEVDAKLAAFNDADQIAEWAKASMAQAIEEGIINGRTADESAPKANATRAESAVMLKRFLQAAGIL